MFSSGETTLRPHEVRRDIDTMLWGMKLYGIRRFIGQRFWDAETQDAVYAARIEPFPRLESVAEHSWHVADTVLLIGAHFATLDLDRCLRLAVLHDKMEISTGDKNPLGRDGTGRSTHAFNRAKRLLKVSSEREAIDRYLARLHHKARVEQDHLLIEALEGVTPEARFVKGVDKLQALAFVLLKKKGLFEDRHLHFTLRYSRQSVEYFPALEQHYKELRSRLLRQVARRRRIAPEEIEAWFETKQLPLQATANPKTPPSIALYGRTGCGKTSVAEYLVQKYGYYRCSTGAATREIGRKLFRSEAKTLLNRITDCMREIDPDVWLRTALASAPPGRPVVLDSMRLANDYMFLRSHGFSLWRIDVPLQVRLKRLGMRTQEYDPEIDELHPTEFELDQHEFDYRIQNDSTTKAHLHSDIDRVMASLLGDG
jgi:5'-deoxynucleotidase YfbR-like HD superfamily hydrolase/dephospho-CoA kinase